MAHQSFLILFSKGFMKCLGSKTNTKHHKHMLYKVNIDILFTIAQIRENIMLVYEADLFPHSYIMHWESMIKYEYNARCFG